MMLSREQIESTNHLTQHQAAIVLGASQSTINRLRHYYGVPNGQPRAHYAHQQAAEALMQSWVPMRDDDGAVIGLDAFATIERLKRLHYRLTRKRDT